MKAWATFLDDTLYNIYFNHVFILEVFLTNHNLKSYHKIIYEFENWHAYPSYMSYVPWINKMCWMGHNNMLKIKYGAWCFYNLVSIT